MENSGKLVAAKVDVGLLRKTLAAMAPQTTTKQNIYNSLPDSVIRAIAEERDVDLTSGTKQGKRDMLHELDAIQPEWSLGVKAIPATHVMGLNTFKLFVLAALHGIDTKSLMISESVGLESVLLPLKVLVLKKMKRIDLIPTKLDHETLVVAASTLGLRKSVARFCSTEELLDFVKGTGQTNISPEVQKMADRYEMLSKLHSSAMEVLCTIYDMQSVAAIAMIDPHPLEKWVVEAFKTDPDWQAIARQIGMEIPVRVNPLRYLRANIADYATVYQRIRASGHGSFTDMEVMTIAGGYVNYSSRSELLIKCGLMLSRVPTFFIPFYRSKAINKDGMTMLLTPVTDKDTFMIAYGHSGEFRVYEVDELMQAFNYAAASDKTSPFNFRRPEDHRHQFLTDEIEHLFDLLAPFPECKALSLRIAEGLRVTKFFNSRDNRLRAVVSGAKDSEKAVLRNVLTLIFEAGMYMRKWDGKGPYPLDLASTNVKIPEGTVSDRVSKALLKLEVAILTAPSILNTVWACMASLEFLADRKSPPVRGEYGFLDLMFLTHKGKYCIRQASTLFIGTAIYYRWCLLGEDFGVEPSKIVRIS